MPYKYKYTLNLFFITQHPLNGSRFLRAAALFTQRIETGKPLVPKVSETQVFESSDQLFSWLRQGELCSEEQIWRLASDFKRNLSAEIELEVSEKAAAKQIPPLKPEPGEVVYSEEFTAKLAAWEAAQKKVSSR